MSPKFVLSTAGLVKPASIDENGIVVDEPSIINMEKDVAMEEAERRAKKYLTRRRFFLDWLGEKRTDCFWIDV